MAGPSKDVSAKELFRKLCESPRPSEVIDFPRKGADGKFLFQTRMMVLGREQHDEARIYAQEKLKKKLRIERTDSHAEMDTAAMQEVYGDMVACELIVMACHMVDPIEGTGEGDDNPLIYPRLFMSADKLSEAHLTSDELTTLFAAYQLIQHKYGPYEETVQTPEELNHWIRVLGEGASAFPLAQRALPQLVELTTLLAQRAWSLSALLESQFSSLPDTLRSALNNLGIGTGLHGEPAVDSTHGTEPITIDQALSYAEGMASEE